MRSTIKKGPRTPRQRARWHAERNAKVRFVASVAAFAAVAQRYRAELEWHMAKSRVLALKK